MSAAAQHESSSGFGNEGRDWLDRLITEKEAAAFLGVTARAMQNWRVRGGGPRYVRISGRCIRYRRRDLIVFYEERSRAHTSEADALCGPNPTPAEPEAPDKRGASDDRPAKRQSRPAA